MIGCCSKSTNQLFYLCHSIRGVPKSVFVHLLHQFIKELFRHGSIDVDLKNHFYREQIPRGCMLHNDLQSICSKPELHLIHFMISSVIDYLFYFHLSSIFIKSVSPVMPHVLRLGFFGQE